MYSIEQRDADLLHSSAHIRYHFFFDKAHQHFLRVRMEIDHCSDDTVLTLPAWIPGSYKIREYISNVTITSISNSDGDMIPFDWNNKHSITIFNITSSKPSATVIVEYIVWCYERDSTIRSSHITRHHAFINTVTCCWYVQDRMYECHHVILHHHTTDWRQISTALSPVEANSPADRPMMLGALNYDILIDSPLEIGNHYVQYFSCDTATIEVAIAGRGNYNPEWITEQLKIIVAKESAMFGGLPFDRYVFILHLFPNMRTGGLEHARSSVNAAEPHALADQTKCWRLLSLLVHEFFHVWNIKRIRPKELGPFDYTQENYTSMLWLVEGATSYYDDLLTYRCGFYTREEYLSILAKDHLTALLHTPGRYYTSLAHSSYLAWVKLYFPTEDLANRVPSYYLKGGVVFLLTDLTIIAQTKGTRSMDDVFRALWQRYKTDPSTGITEQEFFSIAHEATGIDVAGIMQPWIYSTHELPLKEVFEQFGIVMATQTAECTNKQAVLPLTLLKSFGFSIKEESGKFLITFVENGSPADIAGLAIDDEILGINSIRPMSLEDVQMALSVPETDSYILTIASDTTLFETTILRRNPMDILLDILPSASPEQQHLLSCWLSLSL
jgi:predicted metalloprotease with PDZ domain